MYRPLLPLSHDASTTTGSHMVGFRDFVGGFLRFLRLSRSLHRGLSLLLPIRYRCCRTWGFLRLMKLLVIYHFSHDSPGSPLSPVWSASPWRPLAERRHTMVPGGFPAVHSGPPGPSLFPNQINQNRKKRKINGSLWREEWRWLVVSILELTTTTRVKQIIRIIN